MPINIFIIMQEQVNNIATVLAFIGLLCIKYNAEVSDFLNGSSNRGRRATEVNLMDDSFSEYDPFKIASSRSKSQFEQLKARDLQAAKLAENPVFAEADVQQFAEVLDDEKVASEYVDGDDGSYDLLKEFGFFDDNATIPEEYLDDVAFYQNPDNVGTLPPGKLPFIARCLKKNDCANRARKAMIRWSDKAKDHMESHADVLVRPISLLTTEEPENKLKVCTVYDQSLLPCNHVGDPNYPNQKDITYHNNGDPFNQITHPANGKSNKLIEIAKSESDQFRFISQKLNFLEADQAGVNSQYNVFSEGNAKIVLVQPNGIPVSDPQFRSKYQYYWAFFKRFNRLHFGINYNEKGQGQTRYAKNARNRKIEFWFLRQDRQPKILMKRFTPGMRTFPWYRFDNVMKRPQNTAIQPSLSPTYREILNMVQTTESASTFNQGQDCIVFWFHQFIPGDITDLVSTEMQEDVITPLEKKCQIIHFWVGFGRLAGDNTSIAVIKYLQGILQPGQVYKTSYERDLRDWHVIRNLEQLRDANSDVLLQKVYNSIALSKKRVKCLLTRGVKTVDTFAKAFARTQIQDEDLYAEIEKSIDYDFITTAPPAMEETLMTEASDNLSDEEIETNMEQLMAELDSDVLSDDASDEQVDPNLVLASTVVETAEIAQVDNLCCGYSFSATKYNALTHSCCEDGSIRPLVFEVTTGTYYNECPENAV